ERNPDKVTHTLFFLDGECAAVFLAKPKRSRRSTVQIQGPPDLEIGKRSKSGGQFCQRKVVRNSECRSAGSRDCDKSPEGAGRLIKAGDGHSVIDKNRSAPDWGIDFFFLQKWAEPNNFNPAGRGAEYAGEQTRTNKGRTRCPINPSKTERSELSVKISAV